MCRVRGRGPEGVGVVTLGPFLFVCLFVVGFFGFLFVLFFIVLYIRVTINTINTLVVIVSFDPFL